MTKEEWIDAIRGKVEMTGTLRLPEEDAMVLARMTSRELAVVENLIALVRDDRCSVGCGECDACKLINSVRAS